MQVARPYLRSSRHGFTLVEIGIVLVIIGLIIGGILSALSMVETAKINRVVTEVQKYNAGISVFKTTYNYLPGDVPNGDTIFGATNPCGGAGNYMAGNGDGWILFGTAWEQQGTICQLSLFNVIDRDRLDSTSNYFSSDYSITARYTFLLANQCWAGAVTKNCFMLYGPNEGIMKPVVAMALDKKIDDGLPYSGQVIGSRSVYQSYTDDENCGDFVPGQVYTGDWNVDSSTASCQILFDIVEEGSY